MVFNSIAFVLFFPIVTLLYFLLPYRYRWMLLLAASCVFYMFFIPIYILILIGTILIDYVAGLMIERSQGAKRKTFLILSLVSNIGVLAIFKYYNFFIGNLNSAFATSLPLLKIILPIGLSFHTFQAMSYTIEVFREKQKAERHLGIYALYVMFYPQLVAGPIERPQNMLHQFYRKHDFDYDRVVGGLKLMLIGFFKKIVIADRLALYVNSVYNSPEQHNGVTLSVATVFFAFQIYCDFSAYSEIAIGAARVMGFDLMTNFRRPYFSRSVSEFWKRWHISLSSWFSDYLYKSMGGNRVSMSRWYLNLLIVFLVSGLWHGANWTFIIWGGLNGLYLIFGILLKRAALPKGRLSSVVQVLTTFALICFSWVFFRANSVQDAKLITAKLLHPRGSLWIGQPSSFLFSIIGILILLLVEFKKEYYNTPFSFLGNERKMIRYSSYAALVFLILAIGVLDGGQFIYFQF